MSSSKYIPFMSRSEARQVNSISRRCFTRYIHEVDTQLVKDAKYRGRFLGEGTFGACYLTHDKDGLPLCVKILHKKRRSLERLLECLYEEAKLMMQVKHIPGMIRLVGVSLWPTPAIVTQYGGEALSDLLDEGKVSASQAVNIITQIVHVMTELTEAGLCHGDLKTDNIAVEETKEGPLVTIIDLGMMKKFGYNPEWSDKQARSIYAPELYEGYPFSRATQVYQVGMVIGDIVQCVDVHDATLENMAGEATGRARFRPTLYEFLQRVEYLFVRDYLDLVQKKRKYQSNKRGTADSQESYGHTHKRHQQ